MYFRDFLFFLHNFCTDLSESVSHLLNAAFFAAAKNSFFLLYKKYQSRYSQTSCCDLPALALPIISMQPESEYPLYQTASQPAAGFHE